MKCKKCGTTIAVDGTGIQVAAPPARPEASRPEPSRPANEPPRSSPFSALSPRWRVAEPSGRQHELSLGELVAQYRARAFEAGTLVCRPGHDEWIPPYDYPEIVQAANPGNESREPFPTFSEDTVALGAAESAALTRQALALESTAPRQQVSASFFDDSDVDLAMNSFDGLTTVGPGPRSNSSTARSAADVSSTSITSRPPAPASERAQRSSAPPAGGRPRSSAPPPRSSLPPAPSVLSPMNTASNPGAPYHFQSSTPPPPSLRPSVPPGSVSRGRPPPPPSGPPIPSGPRPPAWAPMPPPAPAPPPEPSWIPDSEPPPPLPSSPGFNHEQLWSTSSVAPKRRTRTTIFVLLLVLLAGAVGGVYLFRPALFERGLDRVRELLGLSPSEQTEVRAAQGPPFDEATAGVVLTRLAAQASRCKEPQGPIGKGRAQVLYSPSGKPSSVAVSKPFHETTVGRCVTNLFQSGEVPPFGGTPVIVNKTFEVRE